MQSFISALSLPFPKRLSERMTNATFPLNRLTLVGRGRHYRTSWIRRTPRRWLEVHSWFIVRCCDDMMPRLSSYAATEKQLSVWIHLNFKGSEETTKHFFRPYDKRYAFTTLGWHLYRACDQKDIYLFVAVRAYRLSVCASDELMPFFGHASLQAQGLIN